MREQTNCITQGLQFKPPAPQHLVAQVQTELGLVFPREYAAFMAQHNGAEGWVGKSYLMLYPLELLVSLNDVGKIREYLPGLVLFASDGGGTDYLFDARSSPVTIVEAPEIGTTPDAIRFCADDLQGFLAYLYSQEYQ